MSEQENKNINSPPEDVETPSEETKKRPVKALILFNVVTSLILAVSLISTVVLGTLIYLFQDMRQSVNFPDKDDHDNLGINTEKRAESGSCF